MIRRRAWLQAALVVPLGTLVACRPSEKERALASRLIANMTTYAVGRHLIDLPSDFAMEGGEVVGPSEVVFVEVRVESFDATAESYAAFVRKRSNEIASETHDKLPNTSMLIEMIPLSTVATLLRRFDNSLMTDAFRTELLTLVGTTLLTATADSFEGIFRPEIQRLTLLSSQLASIESETAGGKGFRLGKLLIAADHDQENGRAFFRSKAATGVKIEFDVNAISPDPSPSLLGRWNRPGWNSALVGPKPAVVREGPITLAGMNGEELLTKASYIAGREDMKIWAESKRPTPGFATPLLSVSIDTVPQGPRENAPPAVWTELDAVTVWDAIVKSVRLRPGAV